MAGRIRDEDIAEVRNKTRIDDVIGDYVALRNAGGGSLKGLCPFHDEKSPSFNVTPARQFFHCFGCGEGGDVFSFLMKIDGIGFTEAVERLAEKYGVQLRREDGNDEPRRPKGPQRSRLVEAHKLTEEFFIDALGSPEALVARKFLAERGFDREAAARFGVGFSPRNGDAVTKFLRQKGLSDAELVASGIVGQGNRGLYDRFRGRLMWPIRESSGQTIGFGARRLFDDDKIEAKYLNTPETSLYKKSHVLYGLDLARTAIRTTGQAVIVEGYTDVMACHLAGVGTAVATCGTAFGDDHARLLRRFVEGQADVRSEVIFTFDGDAAGQKAALKAFAGDQNFASQTYVAVEPSGMDPCELRLAKGDEAVVELVAGRTPLYRFVLSNVLSRFDLDRADSRVDALREAAQLVSSVRDKSKVEGFTRELALSVGVDVEQARAEVRRAVANPRRPQSHPQRATATAAAPAAPETPAAPPRLPMPDPRDKRIAVERETLKLVLHHPNVVGHAMRSVAPEDFTHPVYRLMWQTIAASGGPAAAHPGWVAQLRDSLSDPTAVSVLTALSVEPIRSVKEVDLAYVQIHVHRLLELTVTRRIADLTSRLHRTNPLEQAEEFTRINVELVELEKRRRVLRQQVLGAH
ncbi:DNA primase [Nocardioides dubius]|uniref:DNA primase n=1 Tax=Nocardioides dubius TaxID=317019 RepID=A0ABN1TW94_9ACTN